MKINLGCGSNILSGFENHDADVDITKPLPWTDDSIEFILLEHVIEHVTGPQGLRFMQEARRILVPGGRLRLCVPQLRNVDNDKRIDLIVNHGHLMVYSPESLSLMLFAAGFRLIEDSDRKDCDGHWKVIGEELDTKETIRVEAIK